MDQTSPGMGEKRRRCEPGGGLEAAGKPIRCDGLELTLQPGGIAMPSRVFSAGDNTTLSDLSTREEMSGVCNSHDEVDRVGCRSLFGGIDGSSFRNCESARKPINATRCSCPEDDTLGSNDSPHCNVSSSFSQKRVNESLDLNVSSSSGLDLNTNRQHAAVEYDLNPFYPYKSFDNVKSKLGASDCGSTTGPLEENESLKLWKAMKKNGFLSCSHGGIPIPKSQGPKKKTKTDALRQKFEFAKREQANRFARIAAPSGLLSGLNPGIINHVRNSKQVHAIIEALVKSESQNVCNQIKPEVHLKRHNKENITAINGSPVQESMRTKGGAFSSHTMSLPSLHRNKVGVDVRKFGKKSGGLSIGSKFNWDNGGESLNLKLSLSSGSDRCVSTEQLTCADSINNLSVRAASVASLWLEFLYEDTRGRMTALSSSRKRVRLVIEREFPSLLSRQFASNQNNDAGIGSLSKVSDLHILKWQDAFIQMENALSEEEKSLETSLEKIKEMLDHCKQGLQLKNPDITTEPNNATRYGKVEALVKECAVRAAAASIYSTCKFVMKPEDVSCT